VLAAGVIWWGVFTALTAAVPAGIQGALFLFIPIRFLLGAGEAVVYPASNQFVARWIPSRERGIANGWIFAGVGAGAGLSPPLITYIMFHYGWRASFWVCAGIGLLAGLVWFFAARDTPEEHSLVSPAELSFIHDGLASSGARRDRKLVAWGTVLKSREVLAITISYFSFANTRTGFSSRPGGTATNISRAPTSIPAAFGSNTGRSSKHMPLFRLRRLGFAFRACRLPPPVCFIACSLSELQATAKLRNRRYSSKRNQLDYPNC
jgi:MFS family permease